MQTVKGPQLFPVLSIVLYGLLSLFFLQLLSEFVEAVYAFGLLNTNIPPELASVLVLLSPLLLLMLPGGVPTCGILLLGELAVACRAMEVLLDTRGRMLVCGLGVGAFLLFFPALLVNLSKRRDPAYARLLALGLITGVSLSILLRAAGSGVDPSLAGGRPLLAWLLALPTACLLLSPRRLFGAATQNQTGSNAKPPGLGGLSLQALGTSSIWILSYFAFSAPNVIARWTGGSYAFTVALTAIALLAAALLLSRNRLVEDIPPGWLALGNVLFTAALATATLAHQLSFPQDPGAYPLVEAGSPWWGNAAWPIFLAASVVVWLDLEILLQALLGGALPARRTGAAFSLASLFLLFMIFAQVFTTVYDYIPLIGPLFRDHFWLVTSLPAGLLALAVLAAHPPSTTERPAEAPGAAGTLASLLVAGLGLASLAVVLIRTARPAAAPSEPASLRVLTYNIQQGYSAGGQKAYSQQLALLAQAGADLIGLQESDTNRISGGNSDLVRYFSDRLNLFPDYGPSTVLGTFGIALLSRYPPGAKGNAYLYSAHEQTAILHAQPRIRGKTYHVFVTHLGNGGPPIQQAQVLELAQGEDNVILIGDFNFRPDTPQYQAMTSALDDAWVRAGKPAAPGFDPQKRIDYIFVSPNLEVLSAGYYPGPQSDHPWLAAEVR